MAVIELPLSCHSEPGAAGFVRDVGRDEPVLLTVYLKNQHEGVGRRRALGAFRRFARRHNLSVRGGPSPASIYLGGTHQDLSRAFGTRMQIYDDGQRRFRARSGPLMVPPELAPWTLSVLGFDSRRLMSREALELQSDPSDGEGMWPLDIAQLYGISPKEDAPGQCVAIIALAGGYLPTDVAAALEAKSRPSTLLVDCVVSGGGNLFGSDPVADHELALDVQVIATLVPSARIVVYFAASNQDSFVAAIHRAVFDEVNRPSVISISWGSAEQFWQTDQLAAAEAAFRDAAKNKVSIVAAAGDTLATAGLMDGRAHVLYPASSPAVLSCGGTQITLDSTGGAIQDESVWNQGLQGTGGGISDYFGVPAYQSNIPIPASLMDGKARRGVPDVAALASSVPGYRVIVGDQPISMLGTSAVTPLWAAIVAMANALRGVRLGSLHSGLYSLPSICREITAGNNRSQGIGFDAGHGWNACTGLGVPTPATVEGLAAIALDEDSTGVNRIT